MEGITIKFESILYAIEVYEMPIKILKNKFPSSLGLESSDIGLTVKRILERIDYKRGLKVLAPPTELHSVKINNDGVRYIFSLALGYSDGSSSNEVYSFDKEKDEITPLS